MLFCFSALLLFSLLLSCKKEIDEKSKPEIPDETSTYWENDYLRYLLKDKVKTVTEYSEYGMDNGNFKKLSFDQNGNLKEDTDYENNMLSSGLKFTHNAENRITRCEYFTNGQLSEIAEFGYGGKIGQPSGDGVARTGVDEFLSGRKNVCVLRPKLLSKQHKNNMFAWLMKQIGKPYDFNFNNHDDHTMYCAKLVGKAITTAGLNIPTKRFAGHDLYFPDDFMQSEKMRIVYHKPETAAHKLMNNLPLLLVPFIWITGIAPLWVLLLILLAAGWIQLKT